MLIREKRFGSNAYSNLDSIQIAAQIEEEKKKRQERAMKFGLGDTDDTLAEKRKERIARFKADQQGGASAEYGDGISGIKNDKDRVAARIAKFGGNPESSGKKRGALEFTLDEYTAKQKKQGNFLKKRHHGVKTSAAQHQGSNHPSGGNPKHQKEGGGFKKRFGKGHGGGNGNNHNNQQGGQPQ